MPRKQLRITVVHTRNVIRIDYNPEEYTLSKDNNFAAQNILGLGSPIVQFVNGNQRTLEIELYFDTYDTKVVEKQDVREQTKLVTDLMRIDSNLHAPPVLVLEMASLQFRCVLSRVSQRFIAFLPDGVPVRARLNCTFLECLEPAQEALAANLLTSDYTKAHEVGGNQTLSVIAALSYDDPRLWRPIAVANGIADPRSIRAGDVLRVPSLPYIDPTSGEVLN